MGWKGLPSPSPSSPFPGQGLPHQPGVSELRAPSPAPRAAQGIPGLRDPSELCGTGDRTQHHSKYINQMNCPILSLLPGRRGSMPVSPQGVSVMRLCCWPCPVGLLRSISLVPCPACRTGGARRGGAAQPWAVRRPGLFHAGLGELLLPSNPQVTSWGKGLWLQARFAGKHRNGWQTSPALYTPEPPCQLQPPWHGDHRLGAAVSPRAMLLPRAGAIPCTVLQDPLCQAGIQVAAQHFCT